MAEKQWRELFLMHFGESLNVRASAAFAGVGRQTVYDERGRDEEFARAWDEARRAAIEDAEAELYRRAMGWDEKVYRRGKKSKTIRKYSDRLLLRLMAAHDPRYRPDPKVQVNGDATKVYVTVSPEDL